MKLYEKLKRYMCKCRGKDHKTYFYTINIDTVCNAISKMYEIMQLKS